MKKDIFFETDSKFYELCSLYKSNGGRIAVLYNPVCGYYKELFFLYYSVKDIVYKLRHEYNVLVKRDFFEKHKY